MLTKIVATFTLAFALAVSAIAQEKKEAPREATPANPKYYGVRTAQQQTAPLTTTGTTHSVALTWAASVPPTTTPPAPPYPSPLTYNVYKYGGQPGNPEPPNCAGTPISSFFTISTGLSVLTWTDGPGIPDGVTRCYFVTAVSATGVESDPSTIVSVLVSLPVPAKPTPPATLTATVM